MSTVPLDPSRPERAKRVKLLPDMEARIARWYAELRGTEQHLAFCRTRAAALTAGLPSGARILEIAPGPGFQAIELARSGPFQVTGLDISPTFVAFAAEQARSADVPIDFRLGDVAHIPFDAVSFDLIVCQAAFRNFTAPLQALDEMHRVLRFGGVAVIEDLDKGASREDIDREVSAMQLSRFNTLTTKLLFNTLLRRRAYTTPAFEKLIAASAFRTGAVSRQGLGLEVRLSKQPNGAYRG